MNMNSVDRSSVDELHDHSSAVLSARYQYQEIPDQITVKGLHKNFGTTTVFEGFDAAIKKGKITSIFGPNGCGKSTLLNMIAGLIRSDGGEIHLSGDGLRAETGYVFQNYREALFPWRSSYDNIAYPLQIAGFSGHEQRNRINELTELFGVNFDLHRYPYMLSGGQQQLIAVMRPLATKPDVLFLDEPFSALDYEMTLSLRDKLQEVCRAGLARELGVTCHGFRGPLLGGSFVTGLGRTGRNFGAGMR